jgi:hypothetical protein
MSVTTTTASQYSPCFFYHVKLNSLGEPIPGTMQGYKHNQIADPCTTAWLPPYQMSVPSGTIRCFPKNHQRFYYLKNRITGKVVPNSLFVKLGQSIRCIGQNDVLEYLVHS